ncbi:MAG: transcriptional repressor [Phycisphaerales bacterium]|nr:transcriptional repressor [Phycisphaerales bacterium]
MSGASFDKARWSERLRGTGLRVTQGRLDVIRVLAASPAPLPAGDVLAALEGREIDRVTVYRTLQSLVDAGLAHRLDPGDRVWRFGLIADPSKPHAPGHHHGEHAHFVCDECGVVRCLEDATVRVSFAAGESARLKVTQRDVVLHGTCERCDGSEPPGGNARGGARRNT